MAIIRISNEHYLNFTVFRSKTCCGFREVGEFSLAPASASRHAELVAPAVVRLLISACYNDRHGCSYVMHDREAGPGDRAFSIIKKGGTYHVVNGFLWKVDVSHYMHNPQSGRNIRRVSLLRLRRATAADIKKYSIPKKAR